MDLTLGKRPNTSGPALTLYKPTQMTMGNRAEQQTEEMYNRPLDQAQSDAANVLAFIPYAKYLIPQEREQFAQMEPDEQAAALGWETLGAALFFGGGLLMKFGGKGVDKLQKYVQNKRLLKVQPVEDAISTLRGEGGVWKGFDNQAESVKLLKGQKFSQDEAAVISRVASGDDPVALKALAWEKGDKLSNTWKKSIGQMGEKLDDGALRKDLAIPQELGKLISPEGNRARWARNQYRDNMKRVGKGSSVHHAEGMMHEQVRRLYGPSAAQKFDIGHVSEPEMANLLQSMFTPQGRKTIEKLHRLAMGEFRFPWIRPQRFVYGSGESVYGTKSKIFDPLINAQAAANTYKVDKINTLMVMMQQRGFGLIAKKATGWEFVPNTKVWNQENLDGAAKVLRTIDNLAESGRRTSKAADKAVITQQIQQVLRETKERSPIVSELVGMTRDYTDMLYKEGLQLGIPKALDRAPLSAIGRAHVADLNKLWGTRAEQMFSTASEAGAAEKIAFTKSMLSDYRKVLRDQKNLVGDLRGHKKELEELGKRLEYGSGYHAAVPKYLEGYMPRVAQRGQSFAGFAKRALVGESGYMKMRQSQQSGKNLLGFSEMLEARTSAQAKQLFFYDEASDAIRYAQTLPEAWRKQTDFTISRLMGQPTNWDFGLADILAKMPGVGPMDEFRAMRAAKTITGMAYSGMLGLRPFAVFRNLTQPLIMVPSEMGGGLRDTASLITGLARAMDPKHREYIRKIGAITDFVPDQNIRPMLPQMGLMAKYDSMRDAFMYFYRGSDRINRYWTGGAAVDKWEWAMKQAPIGSGAFGRKLGLHHRPSWDRTEIEALMRLGKHDEAKAHYVKQIIADTQYLYQTAHSPQAMGSGGAQRALMTFHSWWMSYGSAVSRWATTGEASDRVRRMGTAMMTAAMAEQVLESWAGRRTAIKALGIGPFPMGDMAMPVALEPIQQMLLAVKNTVQGHAWDSEEHRAAGVRAFKKMIKSTTAFAVPGGLMMNQAVRGFEKGGWPGAVTGVMQSSGEKFEPLWGIGR